MDILQVAPYFIPYLGGQERYIYQLSKKLVENHQSITVLTSNFPPTSETEKIDGITVQRKKVIIKPLRNPISPGFFSLKKIAGEYDIIHGHNEYSFPVMLAAYLKNKEKTPMILTNHLGQLNFEDHLKNKVGQLYLQTMGKGIWNRCDVIVVLSDSQKEFLTSVKPEIAPKIEVIPNAIDLDSFKQYSLNKIRKDPDVSVVLQEDGSFRLLYVGQLIKRKGLKWLIMAVNMLKDKYPHLKLIMVGEGEDQEYFMDIVKKLKLQEFIEFSGRIDDTKELVALYYSSDVFVLPSLSEGLPTVILEAFYFGLPVIATNIPGIKEFSSFATLVPSRDEEKLAEAIENLLLEENSQGVKLVAAEAHKLVESKYNWDVVASEYQRIYEELLPD